jgi:hypothetical protein
MDDELETGDDAEGGRVWNMMALEEALVRVLGRWLLRPVEHVRRAAVAFEKQNLMSPSLQAIKRTSGAEETSKEAQGGCQVGIHVRVPMFDFELRQVLSVHADSRRPMSTDKASLMSCASIALQMRLDTAPPPLLTCTTHPLNLQPSNTPTPTPNPPQTPTLNPQPLILPAGAVLGRGTSIAVCQIHPRGPRHLPPSPQPHVTPPVRPLVSLRGGGRRHAQSRRRRRGCRRKCPRGTRACAWRRR